MSAAKATKSASAADPALPAQESRKIHSTRFKLAEQLRNVWSIVPERGTPFEAVLDPSYWAFVAERLRAADRIEVHAEDGSYFGELIVREADQLFANVAVLRMVEFPPHESSEPLPDFFVSWRGPHYRHCVVRLKDGAILKTNFDSKDAAMAWLAGNVKMLAA